MTSYYEANRERWVGYRETRRVNAPQCVIVTCEGREHAQGVCVKHYKRWRRHGAFYSPRAIAGLRTQQQRNRDYYERNRLHLIAYQRARRGADLEAARAYERETYRRRRPRVQATNRARERRMEYPSCETVEFEQVLRGDPCSYCGGRAGQVDHVEPVIHGGRNHWTNLTSACQSCNRQKSDKPLLAALSEG